jgi:hypothetical protein
MSKNECRALNRRNANTPHSATPADGPSVHRMARNASLANPTADHSDL